MNKNTAKKFLLSCLLFLPFFFGNTGKSELKDISKPYTGIYECKCFRIGTEEKTDAFDKLTVELKEDGTLILFCETAFGKRTETATYEMSEDGNFIRVKGELFGKKAEREFPYKDGEITVVFGLQKKTVYIRFER